MEEIKKIWKEWRKVVLIGLGIFVLALFLRLYNLTTLPIFGDEAIYIRWSQVMSAEAGLRFLPLSDGKQPLFMWVLMFFVRRFSDPLFIGRLLSVVTGMGTLVGIFILASYLFDKKIGLIASFFWSISPYSLFFDRLALVDSMLTMFGVWVLLLAAVMAKTLRLDTAILAGFALGGALLTKSPALFFVVLLPISWIVSDWPRWRKGQFLGKKTLVHLTKLALLSLVTLVIGYGIYNVLRLGPNFHMVSARNKDYVYSLSHLWTNPKDPFISHFNQAIEWLWLLGPSLLLLFIVLGFVFNLKKYWKEVSLLSAWGLGPILVQSEFAKVFTSRYILFSLPALLLLAALTFAIKIEALPRWLKRLVKGRKELNHLFSLGLIIFALHALIIDWLLFTNIEAAPLPRVMRSGYLEEWTAGTGIKEVADLIREEYLGAPDEKIVVGTEGYFGTLPDGLQIYLNDLPAITVIGVGLDLKEVPEPLLESKKAGNKTYLVINSSRFLGDGEELGLELQAVYPKAFRPEGAKEYVIHGPRDTLYLFAVTEGAIAPQSEKL